MRITGQLTECQGVAPSEAIPNFLDKCDNSNKYGATVSREAVTQK